MTPRNPKRNKPPGAAFSDVEVREALRSILARQDMMEARQVEMMNQLEVLGRQASVQQQALMDTLEAAKSALVAVERYDRTPSLLFLPQYMCGTQCRCGRYNTVNGILRAATGDQVAMLKKPSAPAPAAAPLTASEELKKSTTGGANVEDSETTRER